LAYADYNSAVWMQALSASDSKRAEEGQARVMKKLGVAAPSNSGPARAEGRKAAPSRQATAVREQPSEERTGGTGGIGGFFNKLLSGVSGRSSEEPTATAATVTELPAEESSGSKPQRQNNRQAAVSQDEEPAATGSIKVSEKGNFAIQFAAVPDEEDKAIAEADRIARKYRDDLDGRTPSLMIVPTNDGGTLYKVVLAPFESRADGAAACETLKTRGLSCMVITKK
jgi:hypothetical protein